MALIDCFLCLQEIELKILVVIAVKTCILTDQYCYLIGSSGAIPAFSSSVCGPDRPLSVSSRDRAQNSTVGGDNLHAGSSQVP